MDIPYMTRENEKPPSDNSAHKVICYMTAIAACLQGEIFEAEKHNIMIKGNKMYNVCFISDLVALKD